MSGFKGSLGVEFFGFLYSIIEDYGFALRVTLSSVGRMLLLGLLSKDLLKDQLFFLLGVQHFLNLYLVHLHFTVSSITFFSSKLVVVLSLLDLIHGGSIREVLDLAGWDAFLLLLSLNGILDGDVLFNSQLPQVFMEFLDAQLHVLGVVVELFCQRVLIDLDLSVFEVLAPGNLACSSVLILLPVLEASLVPFFHERLVFLHLLKGLLSLLLLHALEHIAFCDEIISCFSIDVGFCYLKLK